MTTASPLAFIAATTDHCLRAFDTQTGEALWRGRLPTGAQSSPMTYRFRADGRQCVVVGFSEFQPGICSSRSPSLLRRLAFRGAGVVPEALEWPGWPERRE